MATVRQAQAWLVPDGAAAEGRELALSYRWDADYPRRDGFAEFHLDLPPPLAPGPQALLLTRTGNQFEVLVEDAVIYSAGTLGNPRHDASKAPHLVRLPPGASGADGAAPVSRRPQISEESRAHSAGPTRPESQVTSSRS